MTQSEAVYLHLKKHGQITSREASRLYGCDRLSSVIHILRHKRGLDITCNIVSNKKNRYGHYMHYGVYKLNENEQVQSEES